MPESLAGASARVRRALEALRRAGERVTPARSAVLRVIDAGDRADEHLTAEQVGARVAELEPSIHRATVYRTLTALSDAGLLSHVHLGGTATVYHLVEPGPVVATPSDETGPYAVEPASAAGGHSRAHLQAHLHAHVQCVSCGKVVDVPPDALDGVAVRLESELGFHLDTSHAALLGRCADCALTE